MMFGDNAAVTQAIFRAIAVSLGLTPSSPEASARVLRSYASPPPPQSPRDANLCFFDLSPDPHAPMLTEHAVLRGVHAIYRFIPYTLTLVFYGPSSETDALRVRDNFFVDGAAHPLSILRKVGIYPIPPTHPPSTLYEEEGSLFRKRTDLVLSVRLLDNSDDTPSGSLSVDPIAAPPDMLISQSGER